VCVEVARRDLGIARLDCLQQSVMDEDVLVLGLDHVVALRTQAGDVAIDVDRSFMFDALQHRVNHYERTCSTDTRTAHTTHTTVTHSN